MESSFIVNCKNTNKANIMPRQITECPTSTDCPVNAEVKWDKEGTATARQFSTRDVTGRFLSMRFPLQVEGVFRV